ncbi:MAG: DJ-1/PfpI family protein [[Clostridium] symbiosum]
MLRRMKGRRLAAICAAPSVLGGLGILKGKTATCHPGFEGALAGANVTGDGVVTDGNVTTAKGWDMRWLGLEPRLLLGEKQIPYQDGNSV